MVTGKKPYDTNTLSSFELQLKIVQEVLPITNTQWDTIIAKSTFKNIEDRYQLCDFILNHLTSQKISEDNLEEKTVVNNVSFSEKHESTKYPSVKIGDQVWMTENLNVSTFRNGDSIPQAQSEEAWRKAGENFKPAWCYFENKNEYGKLYNWYAVNDPRGLAPQGWHVPKDEEWFKLISYLGGKNIAGQKMKSTSRWRSISFLKSGNGTNESGFTGLPFGKRGHFGNFSSIGVGGYWWSSSESDHKNASNLYLKYNNGNIFNCSLFKKNGFSVRCIRD